MEREKAKQLDSLEQRLKDRKQNRLREIEEVRRQSEKHLNDATVKINSEITQEIKQVESLLKPIKDEKERMDVIVNAVASESAILETQDSEKFDVTISKQA